MTAPAAGFFAGAGGPIISGGLSALGGFLGGNQQQKAQQKQTKEQAREYNMSGWAGAERGAETAGLRDKLLAMFGQIAQGGPQAFQPRDAFNPTGQSQGQPTGPSQGQMGGMNPAQLSLPSTYKMGDGGVNADFYPWMLRQLGYHTPDMPDRLKTAADDKAKLAAYMQSLQPKPQMPSGPMGNPMGQTGRVGGYNPYGGGF